MKRFLFQKVQSKLGSRSPLGDLTKIKGAATLVARPAKLVTGGARRRLAGPILMQTRGGVAPRSGVGQALRTDRARVSDALLKEALPTSAYAPQSVNFGQLKIKQAVRATVTVICPTDGEVSVRHKDKFSQTRVVQLSVFGGDWSSDEPKSAAPVLAATSSNGHIATKAGHELRVELEFVSSQTGRIDGALELTGESWRVKVPTTASVSLLGPLVGALILPVDRALTAITGTTIEVPMRVLSLSQSAVTARLTPQELPAGVSAEPFSIGIAPGQTLSGTLRLRLSENAPESLEAPLRFSLETTGGPAKGQVALSLNIYQPWQEFRFDAIQNDKFGSFTGFMGAVQIKSDGSWNLEATGTNYGVEKSNVSFAFKGMGTAGMLYAERVSGEGKFLIRRSGTSLWLKEHFGDAIRAGVVATVFE